MDKKLKQMLEQFLVDSDRLIDDYTDDESGHLIICSESFATLTGILKEGLAINNKIIEEKLYQDNQVIQDCLSNISEKVSKIEINEENAKKINTKNAINKWEDLHAELLVLVMLLLAENVDGSGDVQEQ